MKKWNAPEVAELNIEETANGKYTACYEGKYGDCICDNDENHFMISDDHFFVNKTS